MRSYQTPAIALRSGAVLFALALAGALLAQSNPLDLARQHRAQGDLSLALNDYRRWLLEHQDDMGALREFAEVNAWLGRTDDAVGAYTILLRAEPGNVAAMNGLG